jgi:hypothetical protein
MIGFAGQGHVLPSSPALQSHGRLMFSPFTQSLRFFVFSAGESVGGFFFFVSV